MLCEFRWGAHAPSKSASGVVIVIVCDCSCGSFYALKEYCIVTLEKDTYFPEAVVDVIIC